MKELLKFLDNNIFYAFYLVALMLFILQPHDPRAFENTVNFYLGAVAVALVFPFLARTSLVNLAGLKPGKLTSRMILIILLVMLFSNCFVYWLKSSLLETRFVLRPISVIYLLNDVFFVGTRAFVEELMFRGFLLLPYFSANNKAFWRANIAQTILFTGFHALIPMPLLPRLLFIVFVLCWSFAVPWLNRKVGSLLPSWILHWTNGFFTAWILMPAT